MSQSKCKYIKKEGSSCSLNNNCKYPKCEMNYTKNTQDAINFIRSELSNELRPKMDKNTDYSKIILLKKILDILK